MGAALACLKDHKANTLDVFNTHNNEVLAHFKDRPEDLLVLDLGQGSSGRNCVNFWNARRQMHPSLLPTTKTRNAEVIPPSGGDSRWPKSA